MLFKEQERDCCHGPPYETVTRANKDNMKEVAVCKFSSVKPDTRLPAIAASVVLYSRSKRNCLRKCLG
jgi:hypothetical protein